MIEDGLNRASMEGNSGLAKLKLYVGFHVDAMCGPAGPIAILSEVSSLNARHLPLIRKRVLAAAEKIAGFIREGITDGTIAPCDPEMACRAVAGSLSWVPHWYDPEIGHSADSVKNTFVQVLMDGMAYAK